MNLKRPNFSTIASQDWSTTDYDLSIFALGFESRAVNFLPSVINHSKKAVALGFGHGHELAYDKNRRQFEESRVEIVDNLSDAEFEVELLKSLVSLEAGNTQTVFVDVSCFSRFRLAAIVNELFSFAQESQSDLVVDFAYSLASFEKPHADRQPNIVVGPAHHAFAGWSQGGYSSTAAVLGLGYEQDQAFGVVEFLQAGEVWAFTPNSPVQEYKPEVQNANELLLSEIPRGHVLEYDVCSPASVIATLESVVRGLADEHSVVLVPFGPKIFVLCSLLVAAMRHDVAVWRVSQGTAIKPRDRQASEVQIGLRVEFSEHSRTSMADVLPPGD